MVTRGRSVALRSKSEQGGQGRLCVWCGLRSPVSGFPVKKGQGLSWDPTGSGQRQRAMCEGEGVFAVHATADSGEGTRRCRGLEEGNFEAKL
jgi:hypothetical protein